MEEAIAAGICLLAISVWAWTLISLLSDEPEEEIRPDPEAERALRLGAYLRLRGAAGDMKGLREAIRRLQDAYAAGGKERLVEYPGLHEDVLRAARGLARAAYEGEMNPHEAAEVIRRLGRLLYGDPDGRHLWDRAWEEPMLE